MNLRRRSKMKGLDKFYTDKEVALKCLDAVKPYLKGVDLIVEPSAGSGVFVGVIKDCLDIEVKAYDIAPDHIDIIEQDYLQLDTDKFNGLNVAVIGNPPFGSRNSMSVKFFKKSIKFANVVGFVLPISQLNNTSQMYEFDLVDSVDLGLQNYSGRLLHCCFNVYKRPKNGLNKQTKISVEGLTCIEYRRDKNNSYLSKIKDGSFHSICSWGNGSIGKTPKYVGEYSMELYFYSDNTEIMNLVKSIDWLQEVKSISAKKLPKGLALKIISEKLVGYS